MNTGLSIRGSIYQTPTPDELVVAFLDRNNGYSRGKRNISQSTQGAKAPGQILLSLEQ
jgi:hypothetical protein